MAKEQELELMAKEEEELELVANIGQEEEERMWMRRMLELGEKGG